MRAGNPTGRGIRLRVYGVRLATVPADQGYQLVTDEEGRLVPTGEQYRIPRALGALGGVAGVSGAEGLAGPADPADPENGEASRTG